MYIGDLLKVNPEHKSICKQIWESLEGEEPILSESNREYWKEQRNKIK
jgi:hypothetical protein